MKEYLAAGLSTLLFLIFIVVFAGAAITHSPWFVVPLFVILGTLLISASFSMFLEASRSSKQGGDYF